MPRAPTPERGIKTTVVLPEPLWRAAKIRAVNDRSDLRAVVVAALRAYLKTKGGPSHE